eukprot:2873667-Prymnesium_polylepis.1
MHCGTTVGPMCMHVQALWDERGTDVHASWHLLELEIFVGFEIFGGFESEKCCEMSGKYIDPRDCTQIVPPPRLYPDRTNTRDCNQIVPPPRSYPDRTKIRDCTQIVPSPRLYPDRTTLEIVPRSYHNPRFAVHVRKRTSLVPIDRGTTSGTVASSAAGRCVRGHSCSLQPFHAMLPPFCDPCVRSGAASTERMRRCGAGPRAAAVPPLSSLRCKDRSKAQVKEAEAYEASRMAEEKETFGYALHTRPWIWVRPPRHHRLHADQAARGLPAQGELRGVGLDDVRAVLGGADQEGPPFLCQVEPGPRPGSGRGLA